MKYSTKSRHFAPHKKVESNKNRPGHRSGGGLHNNRNSRNNNIAASLIQLFFGKMSRRTRRVYMEQERALRQK
jgi:hypothetical protein